MRRARTFFFVSLGILALAFAFHLGASNAQSQSSTAAVAGFYDPDHRLWVIVAQNGDTYVGDRSAEPTRFFFSGNAFTGSQPISTVPTTLGRVKAKYR